MLRLLLPLLLLSSYSFSQRKSLKEKQLFIGSWYSENDKTSGFTFHKNGTGVRRIGGVDHPMKFSFTEQFSDCDPARKGTEDDGTYFLRVTSLDGSKIACFEIYGIDKTILSMAPFGRGEPVVYKRRTTTSIK